jgi:two-component system CitB family sensor kinase
MKLHYKIALSISLLIILIVAGLSLVVYGQLNAALEKQMGLAAMDLANTISSIKQIQSGLGEKLDPEQIQDIVEPIRVKTRYQYIIVMDMDGIQYSYPNSSGVGKPYKNGGEKIVLEEGKAYISADNNALIDSIRAFAPVKYNGKQVGAILVGLLTDQVRLESEIHKNSVEIALVLSVFIGMPVAFILSLNIKRSIFGLEPKEIALLLSEKELILQSLERGLIAVDKDDRIILSNPKGRNMIGHPDETENQKLADYTPELSERLKLAIKQDAGCENETFILQDSQTVLISICLMRSSKNIPTGVVVSIDNLTQIREFAEEITDYRVLVDALRAQNHEFMNRLHTLSGLLQLGYHDEALQYVDSISSNSRNLDYLLTEQIRNHKVAGLILSKYNQLAERHIDLEISEASRLEPRPEQISEDELCSIIGNLIDNSLESLLESNQEEKKIALLIRDDSDSLEIEVFNNGPEINQEIADQIFEKGFSTKENGHGIGLYLVRSIVLKVGGTLIWQNDKGVVWNVIIPKN